MKHWWRLRARAPRTLPVAEAYARWAPSYASEAHNPLMTLEEEAMLGLLPAVSGARALDLGCGSGRFSLGLRERFDARIIGIDPSPKMLSRAPLRKGLSYIQAAAEALPLADRSVDVVFMSMVWQHLRDRQLAGSQIARVLRIGGSLCIRTSTLETLDSSLYLCFFPTARRIEVRMEEDAENADDWRIIYEVHVPLAWSQFNEYLNRWCLACGDFPTNVEHGQGLPQVSPHVFLGVPN